jgi:hypothetical protein
MYKKMQKTQDYKCDGCNFYTYNKYDYSLHIKTKKHINTINRKINENYKCECGKIYKHRQSLYTHKKKCKNDKNSIVIIEPPKQEESTSKNDIIEQSMKLQNSIVEQYMKMQTNFLEQNTKLQNVLTELIPKMDMVKYNEQNLTNNINTKNINNINNTNTLNNNINQNFNINLFLNENCKDAMSIGDFVKNIKVSVDDLLLNKEKGIIEGISNLIIKHLEEMPLVQRPLWCSDKNKKKLFIKNTEWEEDIDNKKTNEAIDGVSRMQSKNINKYIDDKPKWIENEKIKETYISIVKNTTEPIDNKKNKILTKLIDTIYFTEADANKIKNENNVDVL